MLDYRAGEVEGTQFDRLLSEADRPRLRELIAGAGSGSTDAHTLECSLAHKDGTTLRFDGSGNLTGESGWSSSGGGCSAYEPVSSAQSGFNQYAQVNCAGKRATPDVSLDADPSSGVSVYDTTRYQGQQGWFRVGGTSASSPMWAGRSAGAGAVVDAAYVYGNSISYRDITSGNNGAGALVGYDLVTGRGSWIGSTP